MQAAAGTQASGGAPLRAGVPAFFVPTHPQLEEHYRSLELEYGWASACRLAVPNALEGKTVVDIGCRRGKGVYKLSAHVGAAGRVVGVDWNEASVREAVARREHAWRKSGLPRNNMEFYVAYPEELTATGVGRGTVDVVFVNSVLHLTCSPGRVLTQAARLLKPGGLLVAEVALASAPRDAQVVAAARALGNSVQAAPEAGAFERMLAQAGFAQVSCVASEPVRPDAGYQPGHTVAVAPSAEGVSFEVRVLHAHRR